MNTRRIDTIIVPSPPPFCNNINNNNIRFHRMTTLLIIITVTITISITVITINTH